MSLPKMVINKLEPSDGLLGYKQGWNDACDANDVYYTCKIEQLQEMLRWYIEEDEINEGDPDNQYWIDGKHKAMKLLGMDTDK